MISNPFIWALLAANSWSTITVDPLNPTEALATAEDYPRAALLEEKEGTVSYLLDVKNDGSTGNCRVVKSSGSASLDDATCAIVARRLKFPILKAKGNASYFPYSGKIVWRLPGEYFRPADSVVDFDLSQNGQIVNCVENERLPGAEAHSRCDDLMREANGKLRNRREPAHVRIRTIIEVMPPVAKP